jgi:SAM-dependent methyltransferase
MHRCLVCRQVYAGPDWCCPQCGSQPPQRDGFRLFAPASADGDSGYDAGFFAALAEREGDNFWFRARNRLIGALIQRWFPQARRMLEVGCGSGFVLQGLQQSRPQLQLSGGDLLLNGLQIARRRNPTLPLYQFDVRDLPFACEFDLLGAFDVIEHLADDAAVLRQCYAALQPGGGLLLTVPQHPWLWSAADDHAHHRRRYRRSELIARVQQAGFELRFVGSFVSLLLPLMLASRLWQRLRPQTFDPLAELSCGGPLNRGLEWLLRQENVLIARGLSLPVGGSLLLAARRPAAEQE